MGIMSNICNFFKGNNTAPKSWQVSTSTGNSVHHPIFSYQPKQAKSTRTPNTKNAGGNWFNGIGTSPVKKQDGNLTVYSLKGTPLQLTATDWKASGGEGSVYAVPGYADVLVKIYKDEILQNSAKQAKIEERIYDMIAIGKDIDKSSFAWPRGVVCNDKRKVIGFIMNKCTGISLQALSGVKSIEQRFPGWTRRELALVAQDYLQKIHFLVSKNILVNDFNPANFLVNRNCQVSFIDCDSYQVPGKNGNAHITNTYFKSHVAPELLDNQRLLDQTRNIHQVEFGAALIIFNILMCGLHPYSYFDPSRQSACGTPDENLRKGRCPLGIGAGCMLPRGNWYNLWSYLTYNLKSSFIQTFRDGHSAPTKRATLATLQNNLKELLHVMQIDPARLDLTPTSPKPKADSSAANQPFSMNF